MERPINPYSTHTCGELRKEHEGQQARLSGWVHRLRDHGGVAFIDLRDHYGLMQVVIQPSSTAMEALKKVRTECVITVEGKVMLREGTENPEMATGSVELVCERLTVHSQAEPIPFQVADDDGVSESVRLKYRFLDLRRQRMHDNITLRSQVISSIRRRMTDLGFLEIQTPILTASSPEGARDYLVPSRVHPGKFYALPQAPQQFKQLLMVSGFPRYFQIAPCFRDEDARADRSPGEFYQLDMEMAFVTQDDVFAAIETVLEGLFDEFSSHPATPAPFPRIPYRESMLKYGTDKPDLRIPLEISDASKILEHSSFGIFQKTLSKGGVVRALPVPGMESQARSVFDGLDAMIKENKGGGLAYVIFPEGDPPKGRNAKHLQAGELEGLKQLLKGKPGAVLLVADKAPEAARLAGLLRVEVARILDIIEKDVFRFCWIVDFPMYERNADTQEIEFSHNPFSMPQGGLEALNTQDPEDILAYQYDIVCNGIELSSGAIRNHSPELMYRAFAIAGMSKDVVDEEFGGMIRAFKLGAPPHGGIAPGVDRIVMLLANEPNIREVIAFPMNGKAEDLLMGAPAPVSEQQLRDVHIRLAEDAVEHLAKEAKSSADAPESSENDHPRS